MFKALVFDLGGVLVELAAIDEVLGIAIDREGQKALWRYWLTSPVVRRFETGQSSLDEFIDDLTADLNLTACKEHLLRNHRGWTKRAYPGVHELLNRLHGKYILASLSNNNPVHWPIMMNEFALEKHFDYHFPSHKTGLIKPDQAAYRNVIETLAVAPEQILFVDDNSLNVEAATEAGMQAHLTKGFDELKALLVEQLKLIH